MIPNEELRLDTVTEEETFQPLTAEQIEAEVLALLESEGDPLGLNPDADVLVNQYSILSREREEMTREHDEVISKYRVLIMKVEEKKKELTEPLDADLDDLEERIKALVLENRENASAGDFTFGYSETNVSDTKAMIRDSISSPKLAAILSRYLSKRPGARKRQSKR